MKKTLIAAALLAGFASTAQAQSVTLYGIVDVGYSYSKDDGSKSRNALDSGNTGSSRWGLRGVEDLGNGLKANFQLESGFAADTGTTNAKLFDRQAWVGLSSNAWGEVRLGRQDTIGFNWFRGAVNPFGNAHGQAQSRTVFNNGQALRDRMDNSAVYFSPKFSGFQGAIGYSFNAEGAEAVGGSDNNNALLSLGLRYQQGPLLAVLTYEQQNRQDALPAQTGDMKNIQLGATYDFGVAKVHAGFGRLQNRAYNSNAKKENSYLIGVTVPFGAHKVFASYQNNSSANVNLGRADEKLTGFALGYNYDLSKRTALYAFFSQFSDAIVRADNRQLGDRSEFAVGVRHRF